MKVVEKLQANLSVPIFTMGKPSPDGNMVALKRRQANWKDDKYEQDIFIYDVSTSQCKQLTRTGEASNFEWIDNTTIITTAKDDEKKAQLWLYNLRGDPIKLTTTKKGVDRFKIHETGIIYQTKDLDKFDIKNREDQFGSFTHVEEEKPASKLVYLSLERKLKYLEEKKLRIEEETKDLVNPELDLTQQLEDPLHIHNFDIARSTGYICISGSPKEDLIFADVRRNFILDVDVENEMDKFIEEQRDKDDDDDEDEIRKVGSMIEIDMSDRASLVTFSPDGTEIIISYKSRDNRFYTQDDYWRTSVHQLLENKQVDVEALECVTKDLDRSILGGKWTQQGIFLPHINHTEGRIARYDIDTQLIEMIKLPDNYHGAFLNANDRGDIVVSVSHRVKPPALLMLNTEQEPIIITETMPDLEQEFLPVETITWTSSDGTEIEGVIRKPADFDPEKQYPLVFIVHGGPSWVSLEQSISMQDIMYYPAIQFTSDGIITVYPNYRGSIGRGQEFQELNVNNLGVGDLWDLESGLDHLAEQGFIDTDRVGCMGWSQGGYISAMATTHSDRFAATSVGAGISDWYSYWMTTDIRKFTHDYLSASPIDNREIYMKTSPMSAINSAKTPTLIQIGEQDKRVPLVNATELYRALVEREVETHLFVFSGMPHGINKPRENLAVITQNYQWFSHFLRGVDLELMPLDSEE